MSNMPVPTEISSAQYTALGRLRHFLRWWRGALLASLPSWMRALGSDISRYYRLRLEDDGLRLHGGGHHGLSLNTAAPMTLMALANPGAHITLEVSTSHALTKRVPLPAVSGSLLADFARHLLPRHTPFDAESAHYTHRLVTAPHGRAMELVVVPRRVLAETTSQLAAHGIRLDCLRVTGGDPLLAQLDLLSADDPMRRRRHGSPLRRLLVASLVLLLVVNIALPFDRQAQTAEALRASIDALREDAEAARALPSQIDAIEQRASFMQIRHAAALDTLEILEVLSTTLPDDTWLQRLQLAGAKAEIIGESENASALIERLQAQPLFTQPEFTRALVRNSRSGKERFTLSARLGAAPQNGTGDSQ